MYWVAMYDVQWEWDDKLKPTSNYIVCVYIITTEERFIKVAKEYVRYVMSCNVL